MEDKLKLANKNIEELIDRLVYETTKSMDGHCLKFSLLGEDRSDCDKISCDVCNYIIIERYKNALLRKFIVK